MAENGKLLGVVAGMGPMAGAVFLERLTALRGAGRDQDHVPAIVWSDPRVPDRTEAILRGGESPLPMLRQGVQRLERAGAECIVIVCNTAHVWYDDLRRTTRVPIMHIVECACAMLKRRGVGSGVIGVMGTAATVKLGLYQTRLEQLGYTPLTPSDDEIDTLCMRAIRLIKADRIAQSREPAAECARRLKARGARTVLLGCTELSLAFRGIESEIGIPLADSTDGLAEAAIEWHDGRIDAKHLTLDAPAARLEPAPTPEPAPIALTA